MLCRFKISYVLQRSGNCALKLQLTRILVGQLDKPVF